jgi:hypothetical protein
MSAGSLNNYGRIAGGAGGADAGATGGAGVAMHVAGANLTNFAGGSIVGGAGTNTQDSTGSGGVGVSLDAGAGVNHGSVTGGAGGGSSLVFLKKPLLFYGGTGGVGVSIAGGSFTNTSLVTGGTGGAGFIGGTGGEGVYVSGGKLVDSGSIVGGAGGTGSSAAGASGGTGGAGAYLSGGTLTASGDISGGLGGAGSSAGSAGVAVQFGAKPATLVLEAGAQLHGAINDFSSADLIDVANLSPSYLQSHFDAATDTLSFEDGGSMLELEFTGLPANASLSFTPDGASGTDINVACYLRGTHIRTDGGDLPIEALTIGNRVATLGGAMRAIRWIGRRHYEGLSPGLDPELHPVRISTGALGRGIPLRDLWVSPEHAMYVDGMLIAARDLINGISIVQDESLDEVTYFHLEFDSHTVIFAEGAPAESFVDDESREMFDNAEEFHRLYPHAARTPARFCAPRVDDGWELEAVRRALPLGRAPGQGQSWATPIVV